MAPPVAGYVAWYDASDTGSITASSGAVSQWNDKSGNGRHLTQGTGANKPTTGTRTQNGLNVIDFDPSSNPQFLASGSFTQAQPATVFVVMLNDATLTEATGRVIIDNNAAANMRLYKANTNPALWSYGAGSNQNSATQTDNAGHVMCGVFNGASSGLFLDGSSISTANPNTNGITSGIVVGRRGDTTSPWNGWIAEIIVYGSALGTTDRQSVESYLHDKWFVPTHSTGGSISGAGALSGSGVRTALTGGAISGTGVLSGTGEVTTPDTGDECGIGLEDGSGDLLLEDGTPLLLEECVTPEPAAAVGPGRARLIPISARQRREDDELVAVLI